MVPQAPTDPQTGSPVSPDGAFVCLEAVLCTSLADGTSRQPWPAAPGNRQSSEMDLRPEEPRQLVGDGGNCKREEEHPAPDQLSVEALSDIVRSGATLEGVCAAGCGSAGDRFKSNCLGIESLSANREQHSQTCRGPGLGCVYVSSGLRETCVKSIRLLSWLSRLGNARRRRPIPPDPSRREF